MIRMIGLSLLLLLSSCCFATCVVIVRNDQQIIAGSESRHFETNAPGQRAYLIAQDDYCKIRKVGTFNFAMAGYDDFVQINNATIACQRAKSIDEIEQYFLTNIIRDYQLSIERMRQKDFATFQKTFGNWPFAMISIFTHEKSTPQLLTYRFKVRNQTDQPVKIDYAKEVNNPVTVLGYSKALVEISKEDSEKLLPLQYTDPVEFVRRAIQYEIDRNPKILGGPLHIIQVDKAGVKWIAGSGKC